MLIVFSRWRCTNLSQLKISVKSEPADDHALLYLEFVIIYSLQNYQMHCALYCIICTAHCTYDESSCVLHSAGVGKWTVDSGHPLIINLVHSHRAAGQLAQPYKENSL